MLRGPAYSRPFPYRRENEQGPRRSPRRRIAPHGERRPDTATEEVAMAPAGGTSRKGNLRTLSDYHPGQPRRRRDRHPTGTSVWGSDPKWPLASRRMHPTSTIVEGLSSGVVGGGSGRY